MLFVALLGLLSFPAKADLAGEHTEMHLASDFDLQVLQFPADRKNLLIWLPAKYGIRQGHRRFASSVQDQGIDVWLVDLHESYLAPTGRYAYRQFRPHHVKELLEHAVRQGWRHIFLGGESRGAALAMQAARQWQIGNPANPALRGMIFYHPLLIEGQTRIGDKAGFLPIARATNLPVYLFQPQHSLKNLHSEELIEQLQSGGAAVYFHPLKGTRGGFHVRDADRLNAREREELTLIGPRIRRAVELFARLAPPDRPAAPADSVRAGEATDDPGSDTLVPLQDPETPPLRLYDDRDRLIDLANHKGEVVLVNFWASWCGPCVKEIASLMRLIELFPDSPFRVLAVNIGENREHVADFFDILDIRPNFQVLFDPEGEAARAWRVYTVPSNYLLDKEQRLRFGYRGALRWDKPSVIEIVEGLLQPNR